MNTLDTAFSSGRQRASLPATARILFTLLERMEFGALTLTTPDGITRRFGPGGSVGALDGEVDLTLHDWKLCGDVLTGGDVAFAEAFMDDRWTTSDLTALLTLIALNQRALEVAFYGRWWRQLVFRTRHLLRSNTKRRARRNIVAHYDLGNDFYGLWLDETMTYSSALFDGDLSRPLASAQQAKYQRMLERARSTRRRASAGDRMRMGRVRRSRGARAVSRDSGQSLRCADRVRASARREGGPRVEGRLSDPGLS